MDKEFKKQCLFLVLIIIIAICAGVAADMCMTPEQKSMIKEKQRIERENAKHQQKDESILSNTQKLIFFGTIF